MSWDKPDELKNWEDKQRSLGLDPKQVARKHANVNNVKKGKPIAREQIEGTAWVLVWTDEHKHFFFNATTKQSSWIRPDDLKDYWSVIKFGNFRNFIIFFNYSKDKFTANTILMHNY